MYSNHLENDMKTKALLLLLLGVLATTGSTCINDGFLIAVNMPLPGCYDINEGSNPVYDGTIKIRLADQIDVSYIEDISAVRYYDIRVSTKGTYKDSVTNGIGYINNIELVRYAGLWSDFATPQTLLQNSPHMQVQQAGLAELVRVLEQFKTDPETVVFLRSGGRLTGPPPVPDGLTVCIEILAQVDVKVQ